MALLERCSLRTLNLIGGGSRARTFYGATHLSGIRHINGPTLPDEPQMPFGGAAAIDEFTELRRIPGKGRCPN